MNTAIMEQQIADAFPAIPENVEELCQQITARRRARYEQNVKPYPRNNPIASDISDCVRETVLGITQWKERPDFTVETIERMERGKKIEDWMVQELAYLGYSVRVERQPFELKDKHGRLICRGRVDGFLSAWGKDIPFEGKSVMPLIYSRINTQEDFDRYLFFRKYPRQLQMYLLANNLEEGFWILDDCMGHWKLIPCKLDYERAEKVLTHVEQAVDHIVKGTLPPFHGDPTVCFKCWAFKRVCTPPFVNTSEGLHVFDDPEFIEKLKRHQELDNSATEYDRLDKEIKDFLKKTMKPDQIFVIGDFLVKAEEKTRNYKAQPAKDAYTLKYLGFDIGKMEVVAD